MDLALSLSRETVVGVTMRWGYGLASSLASSINALISRTEADFPELQDVASMVYVGDVYVLRVQDRVRHTDGWGKYCYSCDDTNCRQLP